MSVWARKQKALAGMVGTFFFMSLMTLMILRVLFLKRKAPAGMVRLFFKLNKYCPLGGGNLFWNCTQGGAVMHSVLNALSALGHPPPSMHY